ncbi:MAG: GWxTD domain-containing protein [Bacteroidetes bacterium]|nr:GWxTD domain-containing protein [Bacteroidota bacterium]
MRFVLTTLFAVIFTSLLAAPQAFFNYKIFYTPDQQPYVVTSLQFSGGTFKYKNDGAGLQANVEITQIFRWKDSIVFVDKYLLTSPLMADSIVDDFYDVQSYGIGPGIYNYELIITDVISGETVSGQQSITISEFRPKEVFISDIDFIEDAYKTDVQNNFVKNGFFMLPYLTNYFPPDVTKIAFYFEIYNAEKILGAAEQYLITYSIAGYTTGEPVEGIFKFQRQQTQAVTPVIAYLPIETLPSGEYDLLINIIDKNNDTLLSRNVYFQRRNYEQELTALSLETIQIDKSFQNSISRDSIPYFLGSIMPISPGFEYETIRTMLKGTDTTLMEKYFYAFWLKTDAAHPYDAWLKYKKQVYYCEAMFGTQIKTGYETDRGRIWLKYGAPDAVMDRPNEPSAYPYQIWQYYRIGQRSNIRFVFYNPDLVTNDYPLLHSEMQGELQNYRWEHDLHKRDSPFTNIDDGNDGNTIHYGGNSGTYYINP